MSASILRYRNDFAVRSQDILPKEPEYLCLAEDGEQLFIIDSDIGFALGYVDSLAAVDRLYRQNRQELDWHSKLADLYEPHADGRTVVRVFDLEGAMRLCELARTPKAALLYKILSNQAFHEMISEEPSRPAAKVLTFPRQYFPTAEVVQFPQGVNRG